MQQKPSRWNVSPGLIAPEARNLWKGVAFVAPLWGSAGRGALLGPHGGPLAGSNLVAGSTLQWRGTPYGLGAGISGASNLLYQDNFIALPTSNGVGTGDFTVVCLANPLAEAVVSNAIGQNVSGLQPRFDMFFNVTGVAAASGGFEVLTRDGTNIFADVAGVIDGKYHLFGGSRDGSNVRAWVDGQLRATKTGTVQNIAGVGGGFAIGSRAESTATRINVATNIVFVAAWDRALSAAEMRLLARDPFCMFRPVAEWRGVWTPLGGAVLSPVDLTDSFGFETPVLSQAHNISVSGAAFALGYENPAILQSHNLTASDAVFAKSFEAAGILQAHIMSAQKANLAFPFESAAFAMSAQSTPDFRATVISNNLRRKNADGNARNASAVAANRTRSITE